MTLKRYVFYMFLISVVCWGAWAVVLFRIDPTATGILGLSFFYLSLFFALTTTFAVLGLLLRRFLVRQVEASVQVSKALRQAVLFSLLIIVSLILSSLNLLTWLNVVLLVLGFAVLEFFFLSTRNNNEVQE